MAESQKYLVHSFKKLMLVGLIMLAISSAIIFSIVEYFNFEQRVGELQRLYISRQELLLKKDIEQAVETIDYERKMATEVMMQKLQSRASFVDRIFSSFTPRYLHGSINYAERRQRIVEFMNVYIDSYPQEQFLLFDDKGKVVINHGCSFIRNNNLSELKSADGEIIYKKLMEGSDPNTASILRFSLSSEKGEKKVDGILAFTLRLPLPSLYMVFLRQLSEHERAIQDIVLRKFSHMQKIREGYIFAGTYQGVSLLGPSQGNNMWDVQDADGRYVVQELIHAAKQGSGFVRYLMPRQVNLSQLEKLSYVVGLDNWQWYVGAGIYLEEINKMVDLGKKELVQRSFRHIFLIIVFYLFVLFIFFTLSDEISDRIRKQIERFKSEFKRAEDGLGIISREGVEFVELDSIAESANRMIEARLRVESQNEEKSNELERLNSELKVKTKEAVQAGRAKANFLANMSHEIRTPLNAIIGMGDVLYDSPLSAQQKEYLGILKRSSEHLLILINDILDFSKIESGKIGIESELIDLPSLCDDALGLVANRYTQAVFSLDYSKDLSHYIHSDPFRLRQILLNLLSNAGKATLKGEVCLRIFADDNWLHFQIIDTGVGIDPDHLETIFELFSQINVSFNKKYEGTGLGLAISRNLAMLLGGSISVSSHSGEGSTFTLSLPNEIIEAGKEKTPYRQVLLGKIIHLFSAYPMERANLQKLFTALGAEVKVFEELNTDFFRHANQLYIGFGADAVSAEIQELISSCPLPIVWSSGPGQNIHSMFYLPLFNHLPRPIHISALFNFFLRVEGNLNELRYHPIDFLIIDQDSSYGEVLKAQVLHPFVRHIYYAHDPAKAMEMLQERDYGLILLGDSIFGDTHEFSDFTRMVVEMKGENSICLMLNNEMEEAFPAPLNRLYLFNKLSARDYIFQLIYGILSSKQSSKLYNSPEITEIKRRILAVDDNPSNLVLVQAMLKNMPIEVILAGSGQEAIDLLEKDGPFDLVLMDIQMPEMDGIAAIEIIREKEVESDSWPVTIFALTAYAMKEEHEKIMASGCNGILTKPIQKHVLCDFMRDFYRLPMK